MRDENFTGHGLKDNLEKVARLKDIAHDYGVTVAQLALAYVWAHPAVSSALVGIRKPVHVLDALPALDVELDDAARSYIDQIASTP
ncbi:aldo/keto reductase [Marinicrinis sediminis]|uniref:Aldo/keto reductase n=1 Tax=Marinicrinis sediminis TaxID=1652465 RepID=A0ABW5RCJ0_9BACL